MPLALYFNENDTHPRLLKEKAEQVWIVGRPTTSNCPDISFNVGEISKIQAAIRCVDDGSFLSWQIKHRGRNKTYRVRQGKTDSLVYDMWLPIEDGDRYYFVSPSHAFTVTSDVDETLSGEPFQIPEVETDDRDRTVNQTIEDAIAAAKQSNSSWASVAQFILTGPKTCKDWVWWLFLAAVGTAIAIAWITHG